MSGRALHNCAPIIHLYVHIPFCARICPYCAFYKERADPAQTGRFCQALLKELAAVAASLCEARVCGNAAPHVADTATSTGFVVDASLCEAREEGNDALTRAFQRKASTPETI